MRQMETSFSMEWWERMVEAMRNAWLAVATRIRFRKRRGVGLLKLDNDVRTCGYEDVHTMWEMLRNNESLSASNHHHHHHQTVRTNRQRRRPIWKLIAWARRAPLLCHP
ncbi:hypothetical protein EJ110_NYTH27399 [Nymphaea thermarum]|nr:hypothetical protein EJ110_NYTH27399 [Nymphaea thermarum]